MEVENHSIPEAGAPSALSVRQEGGGSCQELGTPQRYTLPLPGPFGSSDPDYYIPRLLDSYRPKGRARMRTDLGREGRGLPGLGLEHGPPRTTDPLFWGAR